MNEEEMVQASVRSVLELDQDPESENRGLRVMRQQCASYRARYPEGHPVWEALTACLQRLHEALTVYAGYLPPVYSFEHEHEHEVKTDAAPA